MCSGLVPLREAVILAICEMPMGTSTLVPTLEKIFANEYREIFFAPYGKEIDGDALKVRKRF
jgi:hypothetical protein